MSVSPARPASAKRPGHFQTFFRREAAGISAGFSWSHALFKEMRSVPTAQIKSDLERDEKAVRNVVHEVQDLCGENEEYSDRSAIICTDQYDI